MEPTQEIKEYKTELIKLLEKSQDSFEKQLSYISAGALGISMAFINDVVGNIGLCHYKSFLVLGWIMLGLTLLLNLLSHTVAFSNHSKTIKEIDEGRYSQASAVVRNYVINLLNKISIALLLIGISCLIIFIALNI